MGSVFDAEVVVVLALERGERRLAEQQAPHRPEITEDAVAERGLVEVVHAGGAARARAATDHALDHAGVPLPPDDHRLLELDDRVDELARPCEARQLTIALDEEDPRAHPA